MEQIDNENEARAARVQAEADANMAKIVERVRKLLALAARGGTEAEAAAAAEKAQELLASYNLDMATIGQGGESGKREDAKQRGGMYIYERELWNAIAQLNFCMYFTTRGRMKNGAGKMQFSFQHRIVGRTVNVVSTRVMAEYLQGAIERLCRERFPLNNQFFLREAVAFREGMSDKISSRLRERRNEVIAKQEAAKEHEAKKHKGANTAFALTLVDVKKSEEAANFDFLHGEGAWAKREARYQKWDREAAEERTKQAKAEAEADAIYAKWAAANPEEAAKEAAKAKKRREADEEKADKKWRNRHERYRMPTARERRQNSNYYDDGYERGAEISLEQQVGDRSDQKRITKS